MIAAESAREDKKVKRQTQKWRQMHSSKTVYTIRDADYDARRAGECEYYTRLTHFICIYYSSNYI